MKKSFIIIASVFALACNNASDKSAAKSGPDSPSTASSTTAPKDEIPPGLTQEEYDNAINLIATSDCLTCHKVDEKVTGPSYKEVSQKYESTDANIDMLAHKVIKGGSGVWGQAMMTPHDTLSLDHAKTMVKYILALKNAK